MVEKIRGRSGLQGLQLQRDISLVMTAQVLACFELLSRVVVGGVVWCGVSAFVLTWVCLCSGVRFDVFCTDASSYVTYSVPQRLFV
jgi:hypothetical protein